MTLLAPLGLLALITLPIIVVLHFRRERLRRVAVSSLMLWQHLEPASGKQRKFILPLSLLLLLHLLVAALLALALAQPQWLSNLLGNSQQHVIVVLDTSTSMAAQENTGTTRLDQARDQIRGLINGLGSEDRLSLIAAGAQARWLASGSGEERADLLAALEQVDAMSTGTDILDALTVAQVVDETMTGSAANNGHIIVLSDLDAPASIELSPERLEWRRIGAATDNRAIVALAAQPRQGGIAGYDIYARIMNYHNQNAFTTLRLFSDDELIDTRTLDIQAEGEAELTWDLPAGTSILRAEISGDDALTADDTAIVRLAQTRQVNAVLVSANAGAMQRALEAIPGVTLSVIAPADYDSSVQASSADLTIFDRMLPQRWPVGGVLVINPPSGESDLLTVAAAPAAPESAPALPSARIVADETDTDNFLDGLSLGSVDFGNPIQVIVPEWAQTVLAAGEQPLILHGEVDESQVAVWAFDLNQGNLTGKLAFPLLVARTVDDLTTPPPPPATLVGDILTLQLNPRADRAELLNPGGEQRTLTISDTLLIDGLTQPGLYTLIEYAGNDVIYEGTIAVNAGTPLESDLRPRQLPLTSTPYIASSTSPTTDAETEERRSEPQTLWPWLAVAALVIITLEWLYVHLR